MSIEGATINRGEGWAVHVALRWSLCGTHSAYGHFGAPTGAPVYVMGLRHAQIVDGRVAAEWITTEEDTIQEEILAHTGDHPRPA